MAFVRVFGKLGSTPAMRVALLNHNVVHQLAVSRVLSTSCQLSTPVQHATPSVGRKDPCKSFFAWDYIM